MSRPLLVALTLLVSICAGPAHANLLVNPGFTAPEYLGGWTLSGIYSWEGLDVFDSPSSGSILIEAGGSASQCIPVTTPVVHAQTSILVPTGNSLGAGTAALLLTFWGELGCMDQTSAFAIPGPLASEDWETIGAVVPVPDGAASVTFELAVERTLGSTGPFVAYFDEASLLPEPGPAALAASLAAMAVAARARRRLPR
jgi:hypothetical protein